MMLVWILTLFGLNCHMITALSPYGKPIKDLMLSGETSDLDEKMMEKKMRKRRQFDYGFDYDYINSDCPGGLCKRTCNWAAGEYHVPFNNCPGNWFCCNYPDYYPDYY